MINEDIVRLMKAGDEINKAADGLEMIINQLKENEASQQEEIDKANKAVADSYIARLREKEADWSRSRTMILRYIAQVLSVSDKLEPHAVIRMIRDQIVLMPKGHDFEERAGQIRLDPTMDYAVFNADGSDINPAAELIVLHLNADRHAQSAALEYAESVSAEDPALAESIRGKIRKILLRKNEI